MDEFVFMALPLEGRSTTVYRNKILHSIFFVKTVKKIHTHFIKL